MAIASGSIFEIRASATTGNVNGAGFNIANANFPTDLTTDANTANTASPVCSSATYTFVAGDVNAYLYVAAGTNFLVGWYQIASVAGGKATLSAAIGAGTAYNSTTIWYAPSTVVGIATIGTPTGGTFGIDYSQQDVAQATATDYASVGSSTTLTSASAGFTRMMVGNFFHQTTTGTGAFGIVGWYEVVNYTNATTVTLDRTPNSGTASVATTGFVGGAGRLNGLEDAFFEMTPAAARVFVKNGSYTLSGTISIASTNSTATAPTFIIGYNTQRGDSCIGDNRPLIIAAANGTAFGQYQSTFNIRCTTTNAAGYTVGIGAAAMNCKVLNSSSTAARVAFTFGGSDATAFNSEIISQNGTGMNAGARAKAIGCYIHDSKIGASITQSGGLFSGNTLEACETSGYNVTVATGSAILLNSTIYGYEGKIGIGINLNAVTNPVNVLENNILYGLATGVSSSTIEQRSNVSLVNDYFNNTADTSLFVKSVTDVALNPQFVDASQITGTTATTSGSTLTQSGGTFGIVSDNTDFLHVLSGTGVTVGIYLITGHTTTTLTTNNALGTSSAGDVTYFITTGHNFQIGTNLKGIGAPSFLGTGTDSLSYPDIGAFQRQETGGTATVAFTFA